MKVVQFKSSLVGDFFRVHNQANDAGWCFCTAWWVDSWDGWGDRTSDENRRLRQELLARGEFDGYLLYSDREPVGWCQVGPRDRLAKLIRQFGLEADKDTWAITCFLVVPAHRRSGLASHLLSRVLADLREKGIKRVEAFPRRGQSLDEMDQWNGPESMYQMVGFRVVRDDPVRPIMAIDLE